MGPLICDFFHTMRCRKKKSCFVQEGSNFQHNEWSVLESVWSTPSSTKYWFFRHIPAFINDTIITPKKSQKCWQVEIILTCYRGPTPWAARVLYRHGHLSIKSTPKHGESTAQTRTTDLLDVLSNPHAYLSWWPFHHDHHYQNNRSATGLPL